jgi:hypothetical protein
MNYKKLIPLLTILLTMLACTIFTGGPDFPDPPIPVSTEAVQSLSDQIHVAVTAGADSGVVTLFITETQMSSFLAYKLAGDDNAMFTDPQVYLRDGQMRIYGKSKQGVFTANVGIVLSVGTNEAGDPKLELVSADFGPFPLPDQLNEVLTALIEEAYTGSLGPVATGMRIKSITIADGVMAIVGQVR